MNKCSFLFVDPLTASYPWYTPYQFAGNMPIWAIDLDGQEPLIATESIGTSHAFLVVKTVDELVVYTYGRFGDVPSDSRFGFGGGTPLVVDGLKYGETNKYKEGAPEGLPLIGPPGAENEKYLLQRSNSGFAAQNAKDPRTGKTILGYNSSSDSWMIVSQQNGESGMTYSQIRDYLFNLGYDNILGFDGSSSSTLTQDGNILVEPEEYKNSTIPAGVNLSVPNGK